MPHPSNLIPKNLHYISGDVTATLTSGYFHSVTALTALALRVKGGGIFEHVDVSELTNDAAAAKYIDPLTGLPFTEKSVAEDADHGDGFYEKIGTEAVTISGVPAGMTVHGRFTEIDSEAGETAIAYK